MVTKNTSFALTEHFASFAEEQVRTGRYGSTSDVVRAGLRLLEERESKLAALRAALIEGEESGVAVPWNLDDFLREVKDEYASDR